MSESVELYTQIDNASKTLRCRMSESIELLTQIDAAKAQDPVDNAFIKTSRMQEFNRLLSQIELEHQHL